MVKNQLSGTEMLLRRLSLHIKSLPFSSSSTIKWRTQIKQTQLVSQISSILLQRHNWPQLLQNLNLSTKLTPSLFLQILQNTQAYPQISLNFFNWSKKILGFQPDLKTQCKLTQTLIRAGFYEPARPILDSLIQTHPPTQIVESLFKSCKGTDFHPLTFSYVLECYCRKGLYLQAIEVFQKSKDFGHFISDYCCNELLNVLQECNEIKFAWCFYASMLRIGVLANQFTWSIIARILSKDGKFERIVRIIDMGVYNSLIYNLAIECYSKRGNFEAAKDHLNEMANRGLKPGFSTYSSVLDGACQYGNMEIIEFVMDSVVRNGYILKLPLAEYDSIIQKLSDLGKTYAVDMFCKRASDEKVELQDASYRCMLRAFSKEGRVNDAIVIYGIMLERGTVVNDSCYNLLVNILCKEDPSEQVSKLLRDIIGRGFRPCSSELSKFIISQCNKRQWREAEELLNVILENGFLPDSCCTSSLVEHYCSSRRIDSAIAFHNKLEKLEGTLDAKTYNVLLDGFLRQRRVEEALRVFDYMRGHNLLNGASFSVMISGLCHENELRKAMKLHDEMLKMGLKPDGKKYRRLISNFK